jgi:hypothetical protein
VSAFQLAQLNIATLLMPLEAPGMKDFVDNLDRINALAEGSNGFVWRLTGEGNDATSLRPFGEEVIVNMSVWRDIAALNQFVFKSAHVEIMKRRKEWFSRMADAYMVLWWVPEGHQPDVHEAKLKLDHIRAFGPTPEAFNFRNAFAAPDAKGGSRPVGFGDVCPA